VDGQGFQQVLECSVRSAKQRAIRCICPGIRRPAMASGAEREGILMYVMQAAAQTDVIQSAIPTASAKLSLLSLFMSADFVVQAVMVGLLLASIWASATPTIAAHAAADKISLRMAV
jgi:hypothetical protein